MADDPVGKRIKGCGTACLIAWANDRELLAELLNRCLERLDRPLTCRDDEKLRDLLNEAGKLLIKRFPDQPTFEERNQITR